MARRLARLALNGLSVPFAHGQHEFAPVKCGESCSPATFTMNVATIPAFDYH